MAGSNLLHHSLREQIVNHLRNQILAGQFKEGEPLREEIFSKQFEISRGPIREAFLQLTQEGLLIAVPNRGVRVRAKVKGAVRKHMVRLRRDLEQFALGQLFKDITKQDIEVWESYNNKLKEACDSANISEVVENDLAFHRSIVGKVGNEDLLSVWMPLINHLSLPYERHRNLIESYHEHKAIVDAIKEGNKAEALSLLKNNIQ